MTIRNRLPGRPGFTLIELLVVVSIIAILSAIGLATFSGAQRKARDARRRSDIQAFANAAETYYLATIAEGGGNGNYPISNAELDNFLVDNLVPTDPRDAAGYTWVTRTVSAYRVCADLEDDGAAWRETGVAAYDFCQTNRQ